MQNLENKYHLHCPQVQYLIHHSLLDDEEVISSPRDIEFQGEQTHPSMFQEVPEEDSSEEERLPFQQFVEKKFRVISLAAGSRVGNIIERLVFGVMGEHLEWQYLQTVNSSGNERGKSRGNLLFTLLLYLLILLLGIWFFPLQSIIGMTILFLLTPAPVSSQKEQPQLSSSLEQLQHLIKCFTVAAAQLKISYVANIQQRAAFDWMVKQLNQCLADHFGLEVSQTSYPMDDFDEIIHQAVKKVNQLGMTEEFLRSRGWQMKINFWKIRLQSQRLKKSIFLMEEITTSSKDLKIGQKASGTRDASLTFPIYFNILAQKFQRLEVIAEPNGFHQKQMKKLLLLLQRQIELQKIITNFSFPATNQQNTVLQTEKLEYSPVSTLNYANEREETRPLCYHEGLEQQYIPQNHESIRSKLERMMQERKKKKEEGEEKQRETRREKNQEIDWGALKKERKVFGIPLVPPKRDMSQYYLS